MKINRIGLVVLLLLSWMAGFACTSAIVSGSRTLSGRPLLWKHRDTSNANSRIAYIPGATDAELGYVGLFNANDLKNRQAWMGMNESGFAVMNTASYNILPEGAEIPANRGQLALLVWNTAGRPEPVNTPAFADVADADTAKAAQWCVEQGLLDAKSESTFKPEGWMPKFKTIEIWNKAFPKQ